MFRLESADKLKHWDTLWEHHVISGRTTLPLIAVNLNKAFSRVLIILGEAPARQFSKVGIPASQKKLMPGNQGLVRTRFLIFLFFIFRYVWFLLHNADFSKVEFPASEEKLMPGNQRLARTRFLILREKIRKHPHPMSHLSVVKIFQILETPKQEQTINMLCLSCDSSMSRVQ